MIVHMYTVVLVILCIIVLVATKHAANAVVQICKVLSHPSKSVLIFGHKHKGEGLHLISRVWPHPVLCQVR